MVLEFENDKAIVAFTPEKEVKLTSYTIKVFAANKSDGGAKKHVYTSKVYPLNKTGENQWHIVIDYWFYNAVAKKLVDGAFNSLPNIIDFSFHILIGEEEHEVPEFYSVHFVRYIPKILNILGWVNAEKAQRIWFTNKSNTDKNKENPKIDNFTWDWAVSESSQIKTEYEDFFKDTKSELNAFFDNNIKKSLRNEINKLIKEKKVFLPNANTPKQNFGTFEKKIVDKKTKYGIEKMPEIEVSYFSSKSFADFDIGQHYSNDGMDDYIATIGTFVYHIAAKGELIYDAGNFFVSPSTKIKVKQLAFYIKDRFDFENEPNENQHLGYWKIIDKKTIQVDYIELFDRNSYFHITNETYNDYRKAHNKGYDFHAYSSLNIQDVDIELTL
ncbi:DUF6402 family protein [uncultured Algibacter sp.]|uniref:DUF6402 family protein n=1 Tax=uncultured Algibacter sp. TaxID=298659 RepID=UPI003217F941